MNKREFYICDDKLFCLQDGRTEEVTEKDHPLIEEILGRIETYYPEAMKALNECYAKSSLNCTYYNFLRVRRFLKCNFGELDTKDHDDSDGVFNFEKIVCPLRGECKYENVICMPRFNSTLSDAELRVMKLYYQNESIDRIADNLYLSGNTVRNHIKASFRKLGIHSQAEFITYANRNHLFD
ncbi:MAG: helix-turn-helix transcriptional regulator [Clostridia bacterium]|nr:helix-turn-helix transcriptional regulator [Clostridia bacterium]